jgi:hypothetical protein
MSLLSVIACLGLIVTMILAVLFKSHGFVFADGRLAIAAIAGEFTLVFASGYFDNRRDRRP